MQVGCLLHPLYHSDRFIEGYDLNFYRIVQGDLDVSSTEIGKEVQ